MKVYVLWEHGAIEGIFDTNAAARAACGENKYRCVEEFELQSASEGLTEVATMLLLPWEEERKPAAECFDHLRRLVEIGCEVRHMDGVCFYCNAYLIRPEPHDRNCPYLVAKAFVEDQQEILRAASAASRLS